MITIIIYFCPQFREGSEPNQSRSITYFELRRQVCKLSNVLKSKKIKKGDRVAIYMPVTIELVIAMLASARIGAVHTVIVSWLLSSKALRKS